MRKLKLAKVATILALMTALAWLSYPTWKSLVASPDFPRWDRNDTIGIVFDAQKVERVRFSLSARMESASETGMNDPSYTAGFDLLIEPVPSEPGATVLFIATGKAITVFDECLSSVTEVGHECQSFENVQKYSLEEAQAAGFVDSPTIATDGVGTAIYSKVVEPNVAAESDYSQVPQCYVDSENFWGTRGSRSIFNTPLVYLDVLERHATPSEEYLPGDGSDNPEPNFEDHCVGVDASWGAGVSAGAVTPSPRSQASDPAVSDTTNWWRSCNDARSGGGYALGQSPVSLDLTDNLSSDILTRNIFFAGVFIGLLGALALELINATFELLEALRAGATDSGSSQDGHEEDNAT